MAYTLNHTATGTAPRSGLLARAKGALADYQLYRQTLEELQALNDRELADLGISRFDIQAIARDSVYR